MIIIRENTEGLYSGVENQVTDDVVMSMKVATQTACMRIARWAFQVARKHGLIVRAEDRVHMQVGRRISELRQERRMALKILSRKTGMPQSTLSQIERAELPPSLSDLFKIARALDVTLSELVAI